MFAWFNNLLTSTSDFMPHGACYLWLPSLVWLHVISDTLIALAYYSIPFALFYFVRKRVDLAYRWVFVLFGVFICLCGTTHLISIWTIWHPDYWLDGWVKLATALVSIITAMLVWPLIPKLLLLPSPLSLQTSKTYLRAIFDATPDAMLISDEQGIVTMANKQAECLLGYPVDELLGLSIEALVPQRFRDEHPALRARFAAASVARPMGAGRMVKALRKDGSELDVEISLSPIQTAQGLFFASALRDITERKRAEASLQASEARFRRMANSSPIMIWITDAIGNPTFVNQSWLDFTGLDSAQASHEDWISSIHPDDQKTAFLAYYQDTDAHVAISTEYRLRNAKGEWRWILDKGTPLYDENGLFSGYIGSAIDITESKQAQQMLQDKERMLSESQRIAHIGSWSVDMISGCTCWSDEMYQIYGVNQQTFKPSIKAILAPIYPDDHITAKKWMRDCRAGKTLQELDFRIKLPDGTVRFIRASGGLQYDEMGKPLYMVGSAQDISERKQIELDQRIAAVAFESQEPLVITDAHSIILRINQAFTESTGYLEAEAVGKKISLLSSGRHDADFYAAMWESMAGGNLGSAQKWRNLSQMVVHYRCEKRWCCQSFCRHSY